MTITRTIFVVFAAILVVNCVQINGDLGGELSAGVLT